MAQSQVKRTVVMDGKVGTGFDGMIAKLLAAADGVRQVGDAAKDLLETAGSTYKSYEDNMLDARGALTGLYTDENQLNKVMETLQTSAQQWASTTIFHTDDVSAAIANAAHAGLDLEQMMNVIPQAMLIAQAGGMDLADGLDVLIKTINATGSSFDDAETIVNQWGIAANSSATTIDEMGEAMIALGASAGFADSTAEIYTMLGVLANVGVVGSQAGTMLRAAMIRVAAPTAKASDAMESLGLTAEELDEVLDDEALAAASEQLTKLGFSAYDADGNLKPMLQIFSELNDATQGLTETERNNILSAIFPTRTITTALALLSAAGDEYDGLFEKVNSSEGYAQGISDIMMSGVTGATETLASHWEEVLRTIGEMQAPELINISNALSGLLDVVLSWPDEVWNGITSGLEWLAVSGAVAGAVTALTSLYGALGPVGTAAVLASFGIGAIVGYFNKLNELEWEGKFGEMDLDASSINGYLDTIRTTWDEETAALESFNAAVDETLTKYDDAAAKFSGLMLTDVITGKHLSESEKTDLKNYAEEVYTAVYDGISAAEKKDYADLNVMNGIAGENETSLFMSQLLGGHYEGLYEEAAAIGQNIRDQMTEALRDGTLDANEQAAISASVQRLNEIEAQIAQAESNEEYYENLYKVQSVSWDSANDFITETARKRDEALAASDEAYLKKIAHYRAMIDYAYQNGGVFMDSEGKEWTITDENYNDVVAAVEQQIGTARDKNRESISEKYDDVLWRTLDNLAGTSDAGDAWALLRVLAQNPENPDWATIASEGYLDAGIPELASQLSNMGGLIDLVRLMGGDGGYIDNLINLMSNPNVTDAIQGYEIAKQQYEESGGTYDENNWFSTAEERALRKSAIELEQTIEQQKADIASMDAEIATLQAKVDNPSMLGSWLGGHVANQNALIAAQGEREELALSLSLNEDAYAETMEQLEALSQPVELTPDTTAIDEYTPPDKYGRVYYAARSTSTTDTGNGFGTAKTGMLAGHTLAAYATGGRATSASIFGEAGAEWAIPEEHSERTAELLNAAREASGFGWGELIARNGGLNGDTNSGQNVVIENYSPTIHASDATGVEAALAADKERLKRVVMDAIREANTRREIAAWA